MKIVAGNSNRPLAEAIAAFLNLQLTKASIRRFADMEVFVEIEENVRGEDVFLVQPTSFPANDNLMELLVIIDALKRASARRITAVMPYFGYARQDRKPGPRTPISAKLVANLITTAGADRVLTMNLHADQIQGFFDIPVDHLTAAPVLAKHFKDIAVDDRVLVSPDVGNIKFGNDFALRFGSELAVIHKQRLTADSAVAVNIIGNVEGKNVMMFDDMITTAGTVCEAARLVRERGAKGVYVAATHGVFAGPALDRLASAELNEIVVTDTIEVRQEVRDRLRNLTVLSVSDLIAEAIRRIHEHRSVSALFG